MLQRFFTFIFDILEKKDPETILLESYTNDFWFDRITVQKIGLSTISFFSYADPSVKKAILEIKIHNNAKLQRALTYCIHDHLIEELADLEVWNNFKPAVLIAIPSSSVMKGFNHSEEIAKTLFSLGLPAAIQFGKHVLQKVRVTPIQHSLPREKRLHNLRNSMRVRLREKVEGRDIIIIDDVTTTGATFEEATRALKAAGARKILCVALAH